MTAQSRATLKANFEDGDTPTGANYADLIDSFVSLTDSSAQTLSGPLVVSEAVISRTSGADANFTGIVSAASLLVDAVTAGEVTADEVTASALSATSLAVAGTVSANVVYAETLQASAAGVATVSAGALIVGTSLRLNSATTAAASTGTGESLPASVAGYIEVNLGGSVYVIPYFNNK